MPTEITTSSLFLKRLFTFVPIKFIDSTINNDNIANPITLTIIPSVESSGRLLCKRSQKDCFPGELILCSTICLILNNPCSL